MPAVTPSLWPVARLGALRPAGSAALKRVVLLLCRLRRQAVAPALHPLCRRPARLARWMLRYPPPLGAPKRHLLEDHVREAPGPAGVPSAGCPCDGTLSRSVRRRTELLSALSSRRCQASDYVVGGDTSPRRGVKRGLADSGREHAVEEESPFAAAQPPTPPPGTSPAAGGGAVPLRSAARRVRARAGSVDASPRGEERQRVYSSRDALLASLRERGHRPPL